MSRHEAEQLEIPLTKEGGEETALSTDPLELLLAADPVIERINEAIELLAELKRESQDACIRAVIEIEHCKIQANRVNALRELEKLTHSLKVRVMRSLGGALIKAGVKK